MSKLDPEEKEILEAFESGKLKRIKNQRQELDRRLNAYESDHNPGRPAEDVIAEIRKRL